MVVIMYYGVILLYYAFVACAVVMIMVYGDDNPCPMITNK